MYQKQNVTKEDIINFLKDRDGVEEIRRSQDFKISNDIWNEEHLNSSKSIGSLMKQISYIHPKSEEEWYNYYLSPDKTKPLQIRGRDVDELNNIAKRLYDAMEERGHPITSEQAFQFVGIRTMYETYIGYEREIKTVEFLQEKLGDGYQIIDTSREDDVYRSADRIICDAEGNKLYGIQIKSEGFQRTLESGQKEYVRKENEEGFERFFDKYGVKAGFCFSSKDGELSQHNLNNLLDQLEFQQAVNLYKNPDTRNQIEGWMSRDEKERIENGIEKCNGDAKKEYSIYEREKNVFIDCYYYHTHEQYQER